MILYLPTVLNKINFHFFYSAITATSLSCTHNSGWTTRTTLTRWRAHTAVSWTRTLSSPSPTASQRGCSRCSSSGHNNWRCRGPPPAPPLRPSGPWRHPRLAADRLPRFDQSSTRAWHHAPPNPLQKNPSPNQSHRRSLVSQSRYRCSG